MENRMPHSQLFIACTPRCGSTFLGRALASTKLVGTPEEWFQNTNMEHCRRRYGLPADLPNHDIRSEIIASETIANGWFSIKIMWETFYCLLEHMRLFPGNEGKTDRQILEMHFPNPVYLLMRREDKLKQAISYVKASQTGIWEYRGKKQHYDEDLLRFDYLAIEAVKRKLEANEDKWLHFMDANGIQPLIVTYEELVKDYEGTLLKILKFAGFRDAEIPDIAKNEMRRMSDKTNSIWLEEFRGISESLQCGEADLAPAPLKHRKARIKIESGAGTVVCGDRFRLKAKVKNRSKALWHTAGSADGRHWTTLRARWIGADGKDLGWDDSHGYLPAEFSARESTMVEMITTAPAEPGEYILELHCAIEQDDNPDPFPKGSSSARIRVELSEAERNCRSYFGDALFSQLVGWKWVPWLGYFYGALFPWICHDQLGWMLCAGDGAAKDEFLFSQQSLGWLKTSSQEFPRLWSNERGEHLDYLPPSTKPCRFRVADSGEEIEVEPVFDDK